ncbi:NUDIX hydrolase [Actinopolymorpha alba]|uniref:NUDIX hydrolase n=1 Tax=Actinopolymorpha alba TaxID=533267 RepID=UPI0004764F42|nr:NUDIX domain-containing protein [Actinopolymorpha alba]
MGRVDYYHDPTAPPANTIVPSVTVVVVRDGSVLLVHRADNGYWAVPGGGVDLGESAPDAAIRETREETGIEIALVGLVGIYTDPGHVMRYEDGEVRQQFSLCFKARALGGRLRGQATENSAVRWVPIPELPELSIHPAMRLRIDDGLAWQPGGAAHIG